MGSQRSGSTTQTVSLPLLREPSSMLLSSSADSSPQGASADGLCWFSAEVLFSLDSNGGLRCWDTESRVLLSRAELKVRLCVLSSND